MWIFDIYSETGVCVSENACQRFGIDSAMCCMRGKGVAEIVKSDQRKSCMFQYDLQLSVGGGRADWLFGMHEIREHPYIRFMLNTYSVRDIEERPIKEMDIVYVNQTYENDILTVQKDSDKDRYIIAIQKDGNYIVKSEIVRFP